MKPINADINNLVKTFLNYWDDILIVPLVGPTVTYGQFWNRASQLVQTWVRDGIASGDTIAIKVSNDTCVLYAYLACAIGNFSICPILASAHPDTIEQQLKLVKPKKLIDKISMLNSIEQRIIRPDLIQSPPNPRNPYLLTFTSGSTGSPKVIVHSLANIIGSAQWFARLTCMDNTTRIFHVLPMAYMAGILNAFFAPLMAGAKIIEGRQFSPVSMPLFWDRVIATQVNTLSITPTIAASLCRITKSASQISKIRDQIKQVQCTSAPISSRLRSDFFRIFGLPLQNCYGMTELGGPLTFQVLDSALRDDDRGMPVELLKLKVVDGQNDPGELWIKSPFIMLGYLNAKGGLDLPVDDENYFPTGDLAIFDGQMVEIVGRKKDIIIRGGINISPRRIEGIILNFEAALDAAVVGVPHDYWGEAIVAWVACISQNQKVERELALECSRHLANFERPDYYFIVPGLPRNNIGKIDRNELRRLGAQRILSIPKII